MARTVRWVLSSRQPRQGASWAAVDVVSDQLATSVRGPPELLAEGVAMTEITPAHGGTVSHYYFHYVGGHPHTHENSPQASTGVSLVGIET